MEINWDDVLEHGADIVRSYETSVTCRQLFYRLVGDGTLANVHTLYKRLSTKSAKARREGRFPPLVDRRRRISRPLHFDDAEEAREWLPGVFRLDRTLGQEFNIYVGSEKDALSALLEDWLDERGIPVIVVGGWSSESYERAINQDLRHYGEDRKSVLLYVGDLDPAGEGIEKNIIKRVGFDDVVRVALHNDQAQEMALPENSDPAIFCGRDAPSKPNGKRCCKLHFHAGRVAFEEKYGRLFQIEVDAVPPERLEELVDEAVDELWDRSAFEEVLERELAEKEEL